jgi:nucleolar protein 58
LLDDLDKELNTYAMRVKEWYGWHFPEMQKIIPDNILYARTVKTMGMRASTEKLHTILLSLSLSLSNTMYLFCLFLFCFMSLFLCSFFSPGVRANILKVDLSDVLPPELEDELKEAAQISMGTEVGGSGGERIIYRFTHSFTL